MIVNEKALLRNLKEAYKGEGYHVAAFDGKGSEYILLMAPTWCVTMERKNVPGKIRGYVAETAGKWPEAGEACLVKKRDTDFEDMDVAMGRFNSINLAFTTQKTERIKPTELLLGPHELWQSCTSRTIVLMEPGLTDMIGSSRTPIYKAGNTIRAAGEISTIYICTVAPQESTAYHIHHLEQVRWVSE